MPCVKRQWFKAKRKRLDTRVLRMKDVPRQPLQSRTPPPSINHSTNRTTFTLSQKVTLV